MLCTSRMFRFSCFFYPYIYQSKKKFSVIKVDIKRQIRSTFFSFLFVFITENLNPKEKIQNKSSTHFKPPSETKAKKVVREHESSMSKPFLCVPRHWRTLETRWLSDTAKHINSSFHRSITLAPLEEGWHDRRINQNQSKL